MPENLNILKHIKYYGDYITEQDFSGTGADVENSRLPAPKDPVYSFIFIEEGEAGDHVFPDGSSVKRFDTYKLTKKVLDEWLDKNIVSTDDYNLSDSTVKIKKKALSEFFSGRKDSVTPKDKEFVSKFKNSIISEMIGNKIQDTEVIFSPGEHIPTTDSIEVTFIITPKK